MPKSKAGAYVVTIGALAFAAASAAAQSYPSKPVRILTGFPPGGPTEIIGRVLADHMTQAMGQTFYVEGKPGAAGNVAGEVLANSAPDGHTLSISGMAFLTTNKLMYSSMTFDPEKFEPISILVRVPVVLEISTKLPVSTYPDFVAYAKSGAHRLNHGSPGIGTLPHLAAELFKMRIGFKSEHVPYRGTGPFSQAMMQRELEWSFDVPQTAGTLARGNAVKVLAVTTAQRLDVLPDVPTLTELGMSDAVWVTWFGLIAPTGTPKDIIDRVSVEVGRSFARPESIARLAGAGLPPWTTTPEEMKQVIARERERWSAVVKANNLKAE